MQKARVSQLKSQGRVRTGDGEGSSPGKIGNGYKSPKKEKKQKMGFEKTNGTHLSPSKQQGTPGEYPGRRVVMVFAVTEKPN